MNILQIGTTDRIGGAAQISWYIKNSLDRQGYKNSLFVADKYSCDDNVFKIKRSIIGKYLNFLLATDDFLRSDWILKTKEFREANIIHCHNLHGRYFNLGTLRKMSQLKPVVWTLHDEWAVTPHCPYTFETDKVIDGFYQCPSKNIPYRILWHNERHLSFRKKDTYCRSKLHVITPSVWLKKRVENNALGCQKIDLIYNGIDTDKFVRHDKMECRKDLGLPQNKKIILFLANGGKSNIWKGWEYAEKIVNHLKNDDGVLFLCVGNNDRVGTEWGNVRMVEHVNDKNLLSKYYSASDLLLFTSVAENFPLVTLEAMKCGLPIVSFDVGGVKEAVLHLVNGYIAEYKSVNGLIDGINYVFNLSKKAADVMANNSIERVIKNFSLDLMIKNYFDLYKSIL